MNVFKPLQTNLITAIMLIASLLTLNIKATATIINVPADYTTIQAAVNAAIDNDTIVLAQGTYTENVSIMNKSVTLASQYILTANPTDITATILTTAADPATPNHIVYISAQSNNLVRLVGLTIQNGYHTSDGAGVRAGGGSFEADHVTFTENRTNNAGGAALKLYYTEALVSACTFSYNHAGINGSTGSGAAIKQEYGNLVVDSSNFSNNTASYMGGAVSSTFNIDYSLMIKNSTFLNNQAYSGGAIHISGYNQKLHRNIFAQNQASNIGGAMYLYNCKNVEIYNNTITGNTLTNHESSNKGAALYIKGSAALNFSNTRIVNTILRDNANVDTDKEIFIDMNEETSSNYVKISYSNWSGDTTQLASTNASGQFVFENENQTEPAQLINASLLNFELLETSPCIDAGNPDLDGDGQSYLTDPDDRDADGSRLDIGAKPYLQESSLTADFEILPLGNYAPLTVAFKDKSIAINTPAPNDWTWEVAHADKQKGSQNWANTYGIAGEYNVSLTVTNGIFTDTKSVDAAFTVLGAGENQILDYFTLNLYEAFIDGQLTGYEEDGVSYQFGYALNPDLTEYTEQLTIENNYSGYRLGPGHIEFDLSNVEGKIVEVIATVADNFGGSMLIVYSGDEILSLENINSPDGSTELVYFNKAITFETDETPTKLVFSSFEGLIYSLEIKTLKDAATTCNIQVDIESMSTSCHDFVLQSFVNNYSRPVERQWYRDGEALSTEQTFNVTLTPGIHQFKVVGWDAEYTDCRDSAEITIEVPLPFININAFVDNETNEVAFQGFVRGIDEYTVSWDFGDGDGGLDELQGIHTYLQGNYTLLLSVYPYGTNNCVYTRSEQITITAPDELCNNGTLDGYVGAQAGEMLSEIIEVELYKSNSETAMLDYITTTNIENDGHFHFAQLTEGDYLLRANIIDPEQYPEFIVTYFQNLMEQVYQWDSFSPVHIGCNGMAFVNFDMITIPELADGDGTLSGTLVFESKAKRTTEAVTLLLIDNQTNEPVTQTLSAPNGTYQFQNIPNGTYSIIVEIPSLQQHNLHMVEITNENLASDHLDYKVDYITGITATQYFNMQFTITDQPGTGIANATITIAQQELLTTENGNAQILLETGEYIYTITAPNYENYIDTINLIQTDTLVNITMTGTTITAKSEVVKIYPNPFTNVIVVENAGANSTLTVSNIYGQTILQQQVSESNKVSIKTEKIESGLYFITLTSSDEKHTTHKIVKQ